MKYICSICCIISMILSLIGFNFICYIPYKNFIISFCLDIYGIFYLMYLMVVFLILSFIIKNEKLLFIIGIVLFVFNVLYCILFKEADSQKLSQKHESVC